MTFHLNANNFLSLIILCLIPYILSYLNRHQRAFKTRAIAMSAFDDSPSTNNALDPSKLESNTIIIDESTWDEELGVWVKANGQRIAPGTQRKDFPKPLYILGYGSLLWKPGPILEDLESYRCICIHKYRMFSQKSTDHRGIPSFPGLVVTLLDRDDLINHEGYRPIVEETNGHTYGRVWLIPDDEKIVGKLIEELDYRESGGYEKELINVQLLQDTPAHKNGSRIQALVYTAKPSNPHFFDLKADDEDVVDIELRREQTMTRICDIISVAKGPSGWNKDYLLNLASYLDTHGLSDSILNDLSRILWSRISPTAGRNWFEDGSDIFSCNLIGWGSNEYGQLTANGIDNNETSLISRDIIPQPTLLASHGSSDDMNSLHSTLPKDPSTYQGSSVWLSAGGKLSALLQKNRILKVWGDCNPFLRYKMRDGLKYSDAAESSEVQNGTSSYIANVEGVSISHNHLLILLMCGTVIEMKIDNAEWNLKYYSERPAFVTTYPSPDGSVTLRNDPIGIFSFDTNIFRQTLADKEAAFKILKLSAGLHHSATITACGKLFCWGNNKHGQCANPLNSSEKIANKYWTHPDNLSFIDIACGARHTVAMDEEGKLWSWGDNQFGALGRRLPASTSKFDWTPQLVENLDPNIRWQRICSGWSHFVARGVKSDGECVVTGWGRSDMHQLGALSSSGMSQDVIPLKLPQGNRIKEIWTGSEYTIALDNNNRLWSCGWNEHGNLGSAIDSDTEGKVTNCQSWSPVRLQDGNHLHLKSPWTESVACGGAHVICTI